MPYTLGQAVVVRAHGLQILELRGGLVAVDEGARGGVELDGLAAGGDELDE